MPSTPASFHPAQNAIRTALQANMQMRANFILMFGQNLNQLARDLRRFDTGEPNAKVAREPGNPIDQVREAKPS